MKSRAAERHEITLRPTTAPDLPFVLAAERDPDNAPFVSQWSEDRHRSLLEDRDAAHLVFQSADGSPVGFAIVRGLDDPARNVKLQRIVVVDKGRGYGRQALRRIETLAFERHGAHRLWLEVRAGNLRARALYRAAGFVQEGELRECWDTGTVRDSLLVLSRLEREYRASAPASGAARDAEDKTRVRRHPKRGDYERETIDRILDEGLVCHVGVVIGGEPFVLPMGYGRLGDKLVLHGSAASRLMGELAKGVEACVEVTLVDGLVIARSTFSHSLNYRSVVVFGRARPITEPDQKRRALEALVEHLVPGRSREARAPSDEELAATAVVELALERASAKTRSGPPRDRAADLSLPVWAGVLPLRQVPLAPESAPDYTGSLEPPDSVRRYRRPGRIPG